MLLDNNGDATVPLPDYYTDDGSLNHPLHAQRGAAGTPRIRAHPPLHSYLEPGDGEGEEPLWRHPRLDLPSARRVLVGLFQRVPPRRNERASQLLMAFGHFVVRDITRSSTGDDPMPIACDMAETRGPHCPVGVEKMEFYRSRRKEGCVGTGEPLNLATAWLDMDNMYGNSAPSSTDYLRLRTGEWGRMRLDDSTGLPPLDPGTGRYLVFDDAMRALPSDLALLSVYLQYHNRRAEYHALLYPMWNDEALFQRARMDVVAAYQSTFESKYIPAALGDPLDDYSGYDPHVDATIDVFFSTSSFRYGHSSVSGLVRLIDERWEPAPRDPLLLRDVFHRTEGVLARVAGDVVDGLVNEEEGGRAIRSAVASVVRGLAHDASGAPDASFVDDMALFTDGSVVTNVQRGRDNGLPSYNDAREWFGLNRTRSYLELAGGNVAVAAMLEGLYGEGGVDDVDAYVGAMLEQPKSERYDMGPLNMASLRDQFARLRDGDRLFYRARLSPDEIRDIPSLSALIRDAFGKDEMPYFPEDVFAIVRGGPVGRGGAAGGGGTMALLDGDMNVQWTRKKHHIDVTISLNELVSGGYIGLGWGSDAMAGAEIWFCESERRDLELSDCEAAGTNPKELLGDTGPFTCCVALGERHVRPDCMGHNYLTVLDSCASDGGSYVTVRAELCRPGSRDGSCFSHEGDLAFIAAYNPSQSNAAHGFSRRTAGTVDLSLGAASSCSDDSAQAGLFALHGATLLLAWLVLAPVAIYIVRYLKDKPWRLRAHISLVGVIGGLMLTLVTAALVSVEGTAFGTMDAEGAVFSAHKKFGLSIIIFVVFMIGTGELRRRGTLTRITNSVAVESVVMLLHRMGGFVMTGLAWYNCYTGLVQIGPYEADSVEVTFTSTMTVSMGYDLEFFGFVRKYLFFPWLVIVVIIFVVTECRVRWSQKQIDTLRSKTGSILTIADDDDLPSMNIETFLSLTKHGQQLSIIDGYVIDIGTFIDVHPGGTNVLRFAVGSDISSYFVGELDVIGRRHKHSPNAIRALRPLVKFRLMSDLGSITNKGTGRERERGSSMMEQVRNMGMARSLSKSTKSINCSSLVGHVFRHGTIVRNEAFSSQNAGHKKPVIRLCISVKKEETMDTLGIPLPSSTFIFRAVDSLGNSFERPYSPARCYLLGPEEKLTKATSVLPLHWASKNWNSARADSWEIVVYEFFISLVPCGKMSSLLAKKTPGKHLMVKGPLANRPFLEKLQSRKGDLCLISQGTGISSALQLINYTLKAAKNPPNIILLWLVRNRNSRYEDALKLSHLKSAHKNFQYLVVSDEEETSMISEPSIASSAAIMSKDGAQRAFLRHNSTEGISHERTVTAMLSWISLMGHKNYPKPSMSSVPKLLSCDNGTHHTHMYRDLVVALCGHTKFEIDMTEALQDSGLPKDQIFRFPEGSVPLSLLSEFLPHTGCTHEIGPAKTPSVAFMIDSIIEENTSDKEHDCEDGGSIDKDTSNGEGELSTEGFVSFLKLLNAPSDVTKNDPEAKIEENGLTQSKIAIK